MLTSTLPSASTHQSSGLKRAVTGIGTGIMTGVVKVAALLLVASCAPPEMILKGTRIGVLPAVTIETADPAALAEGAGLPEIVNMDAAPMPGLNAGHAGGNPKFQAPMTRVWSANIGGTATALTDLALPVVGDGRVYTVAPNGVVSAFDVKNGAAIWSVEIEKIKDDPLPGIGGGIALSPQGLVVHAGGRVLSLINPASGEISWSVRVELPFRGGPTIIGSDRAVVTDLDGNMKAVSLVAGDLLWTHLGIAANTVVFGARPRPLPMARSHLLALAARSAISMQAMAS